MAEEREERRVGLKWRVVKVFNARPAENPYTPRPAKRIMVDVEGIGYRYIYVPTEEMSPERIAEEVKKRWEEEWQYEMVSGEL